MRLAPPTVAGLRVPNAAYLSLPAETLLAAYDVFFALLAVEVLSTASSGEREKVA